MNKPFLSTILLFCISAAVAQKDKFGIVYYTVYPRNLFWRLNKTLVPNH